MARKQTDIAVTKARVSLREDFQRMLDELAATGRKMSGSEVESLISEAVAESRCKVRAAPARSRGRTRT